MKNLNGKFDSWIERNRKGIVFVNGAALVLTALGIFYGIYAGAKGIQEKVEEKNKLYQQRMEYHESKR